MSHRVAVLTSGGDAPGMNAAVRAFVRSADYHGLKVFGVRGGYEGLLNENIKPLSPRDVGMVISQGGTFLKTSRSERFPTEAGLKQAADHLKKHEIGSLCVIGGNGSFAGLLALSKLFKGKQIGIPGTIDNDIPGTEYTIGFSTAVETAVSAIDNIRDTATSHNRIFIVEVMGRHSGQIALAVALASGAEDVLVPEEKTDIKGLVKRIESGRQKGKRFGIIVVAEGNDAGGAFKVAEQVNQLTGLPLKVSVLGHIQRGGVPLAEDRIWASRMGEAAVNFILGKENLVFTGVVRGEVVPIDLKIGASGVRTIDPDMVHLIRIMSN